jgi:hypothetical protein
MAKEYVIPIVEDNYGRLMDAINTLIRKEVLAEREKCAQHIEYLVEQRTPANKIADAIRALPI